jgi:hypothetical protein
MTTDTFTWIDTDGDRLVVIPDRVTGKTHFTIYPSTAAPSINIPITPEQLHEIAVWIATNLTEITIQVADRMLLLSRAVSTTPGGQITLVDIHATSGLQLEQVGISGSADLNDYLINLDAQVRDVHVRVPDVEVPDVVIPSPLVCTLDGGSLTYVVWRQGSAIEIECETCGAKWESTHSQHFAPVRHS